MGIYIYTLRAATKTVGNVEIGQFKYGWKPFWGDERSPVINSLRAAAQRAYDKLSRKGVELFVSGDWRDGDEVKWMAGPVSSYTEELNAPVIGHLCKDSRGRWFLNLLSEQELLLAHQEVGVLNGEDADGNYEKHYYTVKGGVSHDIRRTNNLYRACSDALILRARSWRGH